MIDRIGFRFSALLAVLALSAAGILAPQPADAQDLRLGVKAALNIGWFSGSDWTDALDFLSLDPDITSVSNDSRVGFIGGVFVEIPVGPNLSVQPELLIGNIGGAYKYRAFGINVEGTVTATALKIPLLLKPKTPVGPDGSLYALIGPTPAFLLGDIEYRERGGGFSVSASEIPDNRFVFTGTLGAGYEHRFDAGALNIEIRYNRTFTN
ncbi:MAG: PorT family protein, partial [Spirochaetaceae bacterium]